MPGACAVQVLIGERAAVDALGGLWTCLIIACPHVGILILGFVAAFFFRTASLRLVSLHSHSPYLLLSTIRYTSVYSVFYFTFPLSSTFCSTFLNLDENISRCSRKVLYGQYKINNPRRVWVGALIGSIGIRVFRILYLHILFFLIFHLAYYLANSLGFVELLSRCLLFQCFCIYWFT